MAHSDQSSSLASQFVTVNIKPTWIDNKTASLTINQSTVIADHAAIRVAGSLTSISLNYSLPSLIIVATLLSILAIVTAFGNLLVGLALFRYRQLRTISNCLIGNLALSDFLLATTVFPLSIANECLGHWTFGPTLCRVWLVMDVLYCTASIWNLCLIAVDRFTATLYPVWYRDQRLARRRIFVYVGLIWTVSAAICLPPLFGWNDLENSYVVESNGSYSCVLFQIKSYVLYSAAGSFFVPFVVTFVLYVAIFCAMRRLRSRRQVRQTRPCTATGKRPPCASTDNGSHTTVAQRSRAETTRTGLCFRSGSGHGNDAMSMSSIDDTMASTRHDASIELSLTTTIASSRNGTNLHKHTTSCGVLGLYKDRPPGVDGRQTITGELLPVNQCEKATEDTPLSVTITGQTNNTATDIQPPDNKLPKCT